MQFIVSMLLIVAALGALGLIFKFGPIFYALVLKGLALVVGFVWEHKLASILCLFIVTIIVCFIQNHI